MPRYGFQVEFNYFHQKGIISLNIYKISSLRLQLFIYFKNLIEKFLHVDIISIFAHVI